MGDVVQFYFNVTRDQLGLSLEACREVYKACAESYNFGFRAFMLGKSISSGRDIFDRSAYAKGWQEAARRSMVQRTENQ